MPTTDQDARALTYLARRLRDETHGANRWDDAGTYAVIAGLVGQNLAVTIERVIRHAADPDAKTPGAIRRPFTPPGPDMTGPPTPPKAHEACRVCGLYSDRCVCDAGPVLRVVKGEPPTDTYLAARRTRHQGDPA